MVKLTFYGGVNEIGGNKILLEDNGTKIFLDFGMSFSLAGKYFSDFLQPRKCNMLLDCMEFGILPDIKGIYRKDYLKHIGRSVNEEKLLDGILISHAHMDHCAYVQHLREDIEVFCSEPTRMIMEVLDKVSGCELVDLKESFKVVPMKRGDGLKKLKGDESKIQRKITTITFGKKFKVGDLEVVGFNVDHSLPGATAFIIYTSEGPIAYTGDLRFHGRRGKITEKFVEKAAEAEPIALITEGTRVNEEQCENEETVEKKAGEVVGNTKELAVVNFPPRDIDRLMTFYNIAKSNGRKLVVDPKIAHLIDKLKGCKDVSCIDTKDSDVRVFLAKKTWGLIGRNDFPEKFVYDDYEDFEQAYIGGRNTVCYKDVKGNQRDFVFYCNFFQLKDLIDVRPKSGSSYIRSVCEPFSDEMELEIEQVKNWLGHFNLLPIHQIHASGHAPGPELFEMIKTVNPKSVIPVHTEFPDVFDKKIKFDIRVLKPELGKAIKVE